jgi:predicted nucleic acid-binding protein
VIFLDTNVLSETMRLEPDRGVMIWLYDKEAALCVSTIVIAEIMFGIFRVREKERPARLLSRITMWRDRLQDSTFAFDEESADIYGQLMGESHRAGRNMSILDGMIAAIALRHNAALATRNTAHFDIPGLKLINPWQHPA